LGHGAHPGLGSFREAVCELDAVLGTWDDEPVSRSTSALLRPNCCAGRAERLQQLHESSFIRVGRGHDQS
jgi:hypothetical protein